MEDNASKLNPWRKNPAALHQHRTQKQQDRQANRDKSELSKNAPKRRLDAPQKRRQLDSSSLVEDDLSPEVPYDDEGDGDEFDDEDNPFAINDEEDEVVGGYTDNLRIMLDHERNLADEDDEDFDSPDFDVDKLGVGDIDVLGPDDIPTIPPVDDKEKEEVDLGIFGGELHTTQPRRSTPSTLDFRPLSAASTVPEPKARGELRVPMAGNQSSFIASEPRETLNLQGSSTSKKPSFVMEEIRTAEVDEGLARFLSSLIKAGLADYQINALVSAARDSAPVKEALDLLLGKAAVASGLECLGNDNHYRLMQAVASSLNTSAHSSPASRAIILERLKPLVDVNALIEKPLDMEIASRKGELHGYPSMLGRLKGLCLIYYKPMNLDARLLEKRGEATPDQLLRKLLHVDKDLSAKSNEGDYVVVSYTTRVENGTEKSYALTPVTPDGEVRYPSGSDETANRMVLGIVEGFQVEDAGKSGRMLDVVNPVAPFILTCKMAVRKGAAPKGTIQLESGHAAKAPRMPIFFLEPATTLGHQTRLIKTSTSKPREELDEHLRYRRGLHTPGTIVGASAHRTSRSGWY